MKELKKACLALLVCLPLMCLAKTYHFANDVSSSNWSTDISKENCSLVQKIHGYGTIKIDHEAGRAPIFTLTTLKKLSASTSGTVSIVPPSWRHNTSRQSLGTVKIMAGKHILRLDSARSEQILGALEQGLSVEVVYHTVGYVKDTVKVTVNPVKLRDANEQYRLCLTKLLPFAFDDVKVTTIYFKPNSYILTDKAKKQIDKILYYLSEGGRVSRIRFQGFADNSGPPLANRLLASKRTRETLTYMKNRQVNQTLIPMRSSILRVRGPEGRKVIITLEH